MKLKSLLLGSAAVLALSTGAQAADPITEFVSLGVCDAYGITGITIESDDTCLRISGEVEYEYTNEERDDVWGYSSTVDWELAFEATTQTDGGAAGATIVLVNADDEGTDPEVDEAYVWFGDTTVVSAGLQSSLFEFHDDADFLDWDAFDFDVLAEENDEFTVGGTSHGIRVTSEIANGFTVSAALEDLEGDLDPADADGGLGNGNGTAGFAVGYAGAGITANTGVLFGDLYGDADETVYFVDVEAAFENIVVLGSMAVDDDEEWLGLLAAEADFDMFHIVAQVAADEDDQWGVGGEVGFNATEEFVVTVAAEYFDGFTLDTDPTDPGSLEEYFEASITGGYNLTESLLVEAGIGYYTQEAVSGDDDEGIFGLAEVSYEPGGNLEASVDGRAYDNGDYEVTFNAVKSF